MKWTGFCRPRQSSCITMPLWSNEEWRARIGSSWCAIGRPFKCKSSTNHQGNLLGHLLLRIISAERILQCGFLMAMLAIITGYDLLTRLIKRCKGAAKGNCGTILFKWALYSTTNVSLYCPIAKGFVILSYLNLPIKLSYLAYVLHHAVKLKKARPIYRMWLGQSEYCPLP